MLQAMAKSDAASDAEAAPNEEENQPPSEAAGDAPSAGTGDVARLAPLKGVWDCAYIEKGVYNGRKGWKCKWCGCIFHPPHASRVLYHVLCIMNQGIAICSAVIFPAYYKRYEDFFKMKINRAEARKRGHMEVARSIVNQQNATAAALLEQRGPTPPPPPAAQSLPGTDIVVNLAESPAMSSVSNKSSAANNALGFSVLPKRKHSRLLNGKAVDNQPAIDAALDRARPGNVGVANNQKLEMAIADLFHSKNISDWIVESPRFCLVLK